MRRAGRGRILIAGSIAGLIPGTAKAFLDSFSSTLCHELKRSGVTVTCLMLGAKEAEFFERTDARSLLARWFRLALAAA